MSEFRTPKQLRYVGGKIDDVMKALFEKDYGLYRITDPELKKVLTIIENMTYIQEKFNKGIKLRGFIAGDKGCILEIYDFKQMQDDLDNAVRNFYI